MINKNRYRLRMIVPLFPNFSIYTFTASTTTSLGPIAVATSASRLESWDVEVIDENNCHGKFFPRDESGRLDHAKLQEERPADVVGLYGSISSTIPRLYELAEFYKNKGAIVLAGGKHIEALPEEALANNIDIVAFREGEITIKGILSALQNNTPLEKVKGIAFIKNKKIITTPEQPLIENFDEMPAPDFNLLRYEKMKYYPINRTRGCNSNCEFCAVKDKARCSSPQYMMNQIKYLVEERGAKYFFEASDHFAANKDEAIEFCRMLSAYQKKINKRLVFTVQTRITDARHPDLLKSMREAGIDTVCIGYESPIDEELIAMKKGYLSKDLIDWTGIFHKYKFYIHGMFIFGYPKKINQPEIISLKERAKRFRNFIKQTKIDTVQVLITIPLPGTELRKRLENENRVYPIDKLGWEYYDGQFPLFKPDKGITPEELQKTVGKIMRKFYNFKNFWNIIKNILLHFPGIVFTSSFTIILGRVKFIKKAFLFWKRKYFRNYFLRIGGHFVAKNWLKNFKKSSFPEKLEQAKITLASDFDREEKIIKHNI